jgi:hypothetical protein
VVVVQRAEEGSDVEGYRRYKELAVMRKGMNERNV